MTEDAKALQDVKPIIAQSNAAIGAVFLHAVSASGQSVSSGRPELERHDLAVRLGRHVLLGFVLLFSVVACHAGDCISIGSFALAVSASDSRTQQSALPGATVVVVHDGVRDSLVVPSSWVGGTVPLGSQETGTFSVTVRKPGYKESTQDNITVASGACGRPNTVSVAITLTPSP